MGSSQYHGMVQPYRTSRPRGCGPLCREGCGRANPRSGYPSVLGWVNRSQELRLRKLHRQALPPATTASQSRQPQAAAAAVTPSSPCYLQWGSFPGKRDNDALDGGLLHMMMSIGCALNEAAALNRTLLLPAQSDGVPVELGTRSPAGLDRLNLHCQSVCPPSTKTRASLRSASTPTALRRPRCLT